MNPYWINPQPDMDEWLHSDKVKKNFFLLVTGHVILWVVSFAGMVFLYLYAQKTAPIEAFTAKGEPAWGTPMNVGTPTAAEKQEEFLNLHLKNVFTYLFTRTEKGFIPELQYYADPYVLARIDYDFNFISKIKSGYSQTFYIQEYDKILDNNGRRIYRVHGILSSHDLSGSSNTPIYLIAAVDKKAAIPQNPLGWYVSVVISVKPEAFYSQERQSLIDEVTKSRPDDREKTSTPQTSKKTPQ